MFIEYQACSDYYVFMIFNSQHKLIIIPVNVYQAATHSVIHPGSPSSLSTSRYNISVLHKNFNQGMKCA